MSTSPKKAGTDRKQEKLDELTTKAIIKCGGGNNAQARYFNELATNVVGNEQTAFESLQPNIKIDSSKAWTQAICLVNAYLKRYKMEYTLKTVKTEFAQNPKSTGYKSASAVDSQFASLKRLSKDISAITFEERVQELNDEVDKIAPLTKKSAKSIGKKKI